MALNKSNLSVNILKSEENTSSNSNCNKVFKTPIQSSENKQKVGDSKNKRKNSALEHLYAKRRKTDTNNKIENREEINMPRIKFRWERCITCRQYLDSVDLKFYKGHPDNAVEEFVALIDPKLMLFTGEEDEIDSKDALPQNKVTHFSVYDKQGHLCPIDTGLVENNALLYFSGYLKPIYDDNPSTDGGIPVKDMGPINEWFTSGFDGGEKVLFGFSTAFGEYYLMEPSKEYSSFMKPIWEKIQLSKKVIEYLAKNSWQNPSYEDLLNHLTSDAKDKGLITEEKLLKHAQFICDQVKSFDVADDEDVEDLLITTDCMKSLIELAGVTFEERKAIRASAKVKFRKNVKVKKRRERVWRKAITTNLVREIFESVFSDQLDETSKQVLQNKCFCGVCENCRLPDCGKCKNCLDKKKSRAKGKCQKTCINRRCSNIVVEDTNNSDSEKAMKNESNNILFQSIKSSKRILHSVEWASNSIFTIKNCSYYNSAKIGNIIVKTGDYVMLNAAKKNCTLLIAKVNYMWDEPIKGKQFHVEFFYRGSDTVLKEISSPREIFAGDECENCPLGAVVCKAEVKIIKPDKNWYCKESLKLNKNNESDINKFFCQKRYDRKSGRFEDLFDDVGYSGRLGYKFCAVCKRRNDEKELEIPLLKDGVIYWKNEVYKKGCGVYLIPETFQFKFSLIANYVCTRKNESVDEEIYPEFYRKKSDTNKNDKTEIIEPFCIGYIVDIINKNNDNVLSTNIELKVQKLYRPENTHEKNTLSQQSDLNLVYWSEEQITVNFSKVVGKCYIIYADLLDVPVEKWFSEGPNRFYFREKYDEELQEFFPVCKNENFIGHSIRQSERAGNNEDVGIDFDIPEKWPKLERPLRTMDVFSGCGGLSEGLHQSGIAETKWAIENEEPAAQAFKQNNPDTIVYVEDCNDFLSLVLSGAKENKFGQSLPTRGDVELLCGGPPCQGFSKINRFNAGQYSLFKNSLVVTFLSYCDYYRPRYFILENVKNFLWFKKGIILKLTLRCLLAMGYQCAFGILQAGCYGIPQIRRRTIILAAAPGEILPRFPEPTHCFDNTQLNVVVDNYRFNSELKLLNIGAPYRAITIRDAMSDLPAIENGYNHQEIPYNSAPLSHFQRQMRDSNDQDLLQDHICKEMNPLAEARIAYIPTASGSDWRDLPNIVVRLSDGTKTNKLRYDYGKGNKYGVCACVEGKPCDPADRQDNTLIPWCLPHTADRQWSWVGLYGRLEWDGFFYTTVTNPEPIGKQGRVLHPEQNRVVSVRECARSQGFPDRYKFYGNVLAKHKQIGNAVPPPMGAAIGREILMAIQQLQTKFE